MRQALQSKQNELMKEKFMATAEGQLIATTYQVRHNPQRKLRKKPGSPDFLQEAKTISKLPVFGNSG